MTKRDYYEVLGLEHNASDEEIKKSYEEYVDQIGKDFADSTTHFQDALKDYEASLEYPDNLEVARPYREPRLAERPRAAAPPEVTIRNTSVGERSSGKVSRAKRISSHRERESLLARESVPSASGMSSFLNRGSGARPTSRRSLLRGQRQTVTPRCCRKPAVWAIICPSFTSKWPPPSRNTPCSSP